MPFTNYAPIAKVYRISEVPFPAFSDPDITQHMFYARVKSYFAPRLVELRVFLNSVEGQRGGMPMR